MIRFRGKRVLVMGLGLHGGGAGTVRFLARHGARVTVTDLRSRKILAPALKELKYHKRVRYVLGMHRKKDFLAADIIVKNQGVPPHSPYLIFAKKHRIPVTSDIGIFFNQCPARVIGVTGTRGKSTAAYLIYAFLKSASKRVFLGGNIRKSVLDLLPRIKKGDWVVLELSSFQLYDLAAEKKSPAIAVFTNIFRDHLDWHGSFPEYLHAKSNIFRYQHPHDSLFINPRDRGVRRLAWRAPSRVAQPSLPALFRRTVDEHIGPHYRDTVALAVAVARRCGVPARNVRKVLASFQGLEGRQEIIGVVQGVHFVNDTTATIPEAVIAALKRFDARRNAGSHIILIAGGHDKKLDYAALAREMKHRVDTAILLPGTATKKIKNQNSPPRRIHGLRPSKAKQFAFDSKIKNYFPATLDAKTMQEAVKKAYACAKKGDWVILSPGAASFGLFANEFDRGNQFVAAIQKLKRTNRA